MVHLYRKHAMEAERLNQLVTLLDDLQRRVVELRGYL
jgi:hypothetical protein